MHALSSDLDRLAEARGFHKGFRGRTKWELALPLDFGSKTCLPAGTSTSRIMPDAVGHRADTADARRSAIALDALLRRQLLRGQVPKQSATPADFGERTAGYEAGAAAGAADHAGGDCPR